MFHSLKGNSRTQVNGEKGKTEGRIYWGGGWDDKMRVREKMTPRILKII